MTATVSNPIATNEALAARAEQQREQKETLAEAYSLQERLERQLAEEAIEVPIGDETIEFRPFNREASQFASLCQEYLENIDEENVEAEFRDVLDRMYAVAAEFSKPDFADTDWFESQFSVPRMIAILTFVNTEGKSLDAGETKK